METDNYIKSASTFDMFARKRPRPGLAGVEGEKAQHEVSVADADNSKKCIVVMKQKDVSGS